MKKGIVYCIYCTANGKKYVGFTTKTLMTRWKQHCTIPSKRRPTALQHAIIKHGKEMFVIGEIESCNSIEKLKLREQFWIKKLRTNLTTGGCGYNMNKGGNWIPTDRRPDSSGPNNHFFGKTHSLEQRQKWSFERSNRRLTPEWKNKISQAHAGKINSPETRRKMSLGKSSTKKPVLQFDLSTKTIRWFTSTKEAERFIKENGYPKGGKNGIKDSIKFKIIRYDSYWIRPLSPSVL